MAEYRQCHNSCRTRYSLELDKGKYMKLWLQGKLYKNAACELGRP